MSKLINDFNNNIELSLHALGFKKQARGLRIYPISDDYHGSVGINKSTKYKEISFIPSVGICSKSIQDFYYKMISFKPKKELISITSITLKELTEGRYDSKWISSYEEIISEISKLTSFLVSDAIPFIKKNANLDNIIDLMVNRNYGFAEQNAYFIPICYHLSGQDQLAIEKLNFRYESIKDHTYKAADNYRDFYTNFLKYLEDGSFSPISQD